MHPRTPWFVIAGAVALSACVINPVVQPSATPGASALPGTLPVNTVGQPAAGGGSSGIRVATEAIVLTSGEARALLPLISQRGGTSAQTLIWTSSSDAVATVTPAGEVRAVGPGSAVITVNIAGSPEQAGKLRVDVIEKHAVLLIKIKPETLTLQVRDRQKLTAQVQMADGQVNGNVRWNSSDDTIATVNDTTGEVSALREGKVTILASYTVDPRYKGLVEVTVVKDRGALPATPTPEPIIFGPGATPIPTDGPSDDIATQPSESPADEPADEETPEPETPDEPSPTPFRSFDDNPNHPLTIVKGQPALGSPATATEIVKNFSHTSIVTTGNGRLIASAIGDQQLALITMTGGLASLFTSKFYSSIPGDLAIDSAGNLYVVDGRVIKKVDKKGSSSWFYEGQVGGGTTIGKLAFDAAENLYFTEADGTIKLAHPDGTVETYASGVSFNSIKGLAFDSDGALYATDYNAKAVIKYTEKGKKTFAAGINMPGGLAFDGEGNLYVYDGQAKGIVRITPDGTAAMFVGGDAATGDFIWGGAKLAFGADGSLFVSQAGTILKLSSP